MKICITGGTGFVGRTVVPTFVEAGHDVIALVRSSTSTDSMPQHGCRMMVGSCLDPGHVAEAIQGTDAVVHLVGIKRAAIRETGLTYRDVDVRSVQVIVQVMQEKGLRRLLLLSAADIGHSLYVQCKREAEQLVQDAELEWTFFRPAFIVGAGQRWPVILTPLLSALSVVPGKIGDIARRAGCVTREQIARSMLHALNVPEATQAVYDVHRIRLTSSSFRTTQLNGG